jgi:hypothetical protein
MTIFKLMPLALVVISAAATAAGNDAACGVLRGASNDVAEGGFQLRDGEAVDFVAGGKTVHGTLQVFKDGSVYRAYWQPRDHADRYVLANAGANSVRLISTPPQGTPAGDSAPGTSMPQQQVLSCPAL